MSEINDCSLSAKYQYVLVALSEPVQVVCNEMQVGTALTSDKNHSVVVRLLGYLFSAPGIAHFARKHQVKVALSSGRFATSTISFGQASVQEPRIPCFVLTRCTT